MIAISAALNVVCSSKIIIITIIIIIIIIMSSGYNIKFMDWEHSRRNRVLFTIQTQVGE